jgi:hypothetical protein
VSGIWYLSFVGDEGWMGGCFVRADDPIDAVREAHRRKCNPGGEVAIMGPVPPEIEAAWMNRLLNRDELEEAAP